MSRVSISSCINDVTCISITVAIKCFFIDSICQNQKLMREVLVLGSINLYKIENDRKDEFVKTLSKLQNKATIECDFGESEKISLTLYVSAEHNQNELSWNWILRSFNQPDFHTISSPKAVVLAEKEDDTAYAITFGSAFFLVDKYCNKNFGFDFARKLKFDDIKTTTLTTPNSHRNKTVNTYVNYNELEFDSGESFAKLKAKVEVEDGFELFKPSVEVGTSIKITTSIETLQNIANIIRYIENIIVNGEEKCKIPIFAKINDKDYIATLNYRMEREIKANPQISISELEVVGTEIIFNNNDDEYIIKYSGKERRVESLTVQELMLFCNEFGFNYNDIVLDIQVCKLYNGEKVATSTVRDMIDHTDDKEKCLLSGGIWYKYNDDYLNYLSQSIAEIPTEYHPEYDFSKSVYNAFINKCVEKENSAPEYAGKTQKEIRDSLCKKYYAEKAFNIIRGGEHGFQNFDREFSQVGNSTVEPMDLYKYGDNDGGFIFAVKIGNTSAKLCYAVDQSLTSLKLYKQGLLKNIPSFTKVVLWFVLERKKHIENKNGKPDLNKLDMLMLKNRIDQWKKEVRLMGYTPMIYINYRE